MFLLKNNKPKLFTIVVLITCVCLLAKKLKKLWVDFREVLCIREQLIKF